VNRCKIVQFIDTNFHNCNICQYKTLSWEVIVPEAFSSTTIVRVKSGNERLFIGAYMKDEW